MSRLTVANLSMRATGDTWPIDLRLTDAEGTAIDISGYTLEMSVNEAENPDDPEGTNLFTITGSIVNASDGRFRFAVSEGNAALLVPLAGGAAYWYDVQVTDGDGAITTIMKGRLPVTGSLTP